MIDKIKKLIGSTNVGDIQLGMILLHKDKEFLNSLVGKDISLKEFPIHDSMKAVPCAVTFKNDGFYIDRYTLVYVREEGISFSSINCESVDYNFIKYEEEIDVGL